MDIDYKIKSDREVLTEMFERNEIEYQVVVECKNIYIEAGHSGFASRFSFNENDNLKSVEVI